MLRAPLFAVPIGVVAVAACGYLVLSKRAGTASAVGATPAAPTDSADRDPTWCGKPLGASAIGRLTDRSSCRKSALGGTAPRCLFWAECGNDRFEIDCDSAGAGQCRCDGEGGRVVAYDSSFCALDPMQPAQSLAAILTATSAACRWAPQSQ